MTKGGSLQRGVSAPDEHPGPELRRRDRDDDGAAGGAAAGSGHSQLHTKKMTIRMKESARVANNNKDGKGTVRGSGRVIHTATPVAPPNSWAESILRQPPGTFASVVQGASVVHGASAVNRSSLEQLALTAVREADAALEALETQQLAVVTGQSAVVTGHSVAVTGHSALAVSPDTMADYLSSSPAPVTSPVADSPDHAPSATMH